MRNTPADAARPVPTVAYRRWLDSLAGAGWHPDPATERVPLADALGRVTAEPMLARWPSPRSDCAAMDGIAVCAASPAWPTARATASAAAEGANGQDAVPDRELIRLAGEEFEWVDTGDPMPQWADTVVVRERLLPRDDGSVLIATASAVGASPRGSAGQGHPGHAPAPFLVPGQHVRKAGEDFTAGQRLVPAGRKLRPGDLAAVAAGGHATAAVTRRPVVAVIPTGDEIRPLGTVPRPGDILDTNSLMLAARCRQLDADTVVSPVIPDDPDTLAAAVRRAADEADLVLVIAGSSRGRGDHTAAVLGQVGGVAVAGIAVRPGHPALLGHAKRSPAGQGGPGGSGPGGRSGVAPVIGLPGYPLATAVIFERFAAPLLDAIAGRDPVPGPVARARLDRDWSSAADVEDWVLVTLRPAGDDGPPLATPARRGSASLSLLAAADAWWPIPPSQAIITAGTEIAVVPIPASG